MSKNTNYMFFLVRFVKDFSKLDKTHMHSRANFSADFIAVIGLYSQCQIVSFFPILGGKFPISNQKKKIEKIIIFIMVKVGLKLSNIHHCIVSYNISCNGDYKLTLQLNLDKYMVYGIL